jgi:hypothetical protein
MTILNGKISCSADTPVREKLRSENEVRWGGVSL